MENTDKKETVAELIEKGKQLGAKELYKEEIKAYKTALLMSKKIDTPTLATLYIKLANAYYKLDDKDKSTYYYELYLKEYPEGQASVFSRLANAYYYIDTDKSIDYHNKGLNISINQYDAACKLFAMTKSAFYDQQDIKDEAEYETALVKNTLYSDIVKYNHDDKKNQKDKRLKIGYLSSDCYAHTMMNYILPIWENHNKDEFDFVIFSCSEKNDATTEKIKKLGFKYISCPNTPAKTLAKIIYDEKVDILVDLGGYTHMRTFVSFFKPAPVIISYLGYLNTLGIKEVDYILTDRYTIPEDKAYLYTEKPLYLDCGYQIFTPNNLSDVEESPYKKNGYITFASFNCTSKLNDAVFYLWTKILKNTENSKLLIYRTQMTKSIIKNLKSKFEKLGVDTDRIIFSSKSYSPHYKAYSLADISLDPYPFSGMSITIENALMGVPTITLAGEGMQSRGAARINEVLNLSEFNAFSGDEYIDIAIKLANDKSKLEELRKSLRNRMLESSICANHKEFVQDLENKYKQVWETFTNSL